jgi:hypothetical protein
LSVPFYQGIHVKATPLGGLPAIQLNYSPQKSASSSKLQLAVTQADILKIAQSVFDENGDEARLNGVIVGSKSSGDKSDVSKASISNGGLALSLVDVQGDGVKDVVIKDSTTGASATLLKKGDHLETSLVSLSAPEPSDLERLSLSGEKSGRHFLAVDLEGSGVRKFAVKEGDKFVSLGSSDDGKNITAGGFDTAPTKGLATGLQEAEARYQKLVGELGWIVPAFAVPPTNPSGFGSLPGRQYVGFVQMNFGNVDPNLLKSFDLNSDNLGGFTLMDSLGGAVGAFDPTSLGIAIYSQPAAKLG